MPAAITAATLARLAPLEPGQAKRRIFDSRLRGFLAELRATGITLYFRYTDGRGRTREIKLGRHGDVTVEQARKRAEQLRAAVALGADPAAETAKKASVPTFADFAQDRYIPHIKERLRSAFNNEAQLRLRLIPWLGRKALDEITQADIADTRRRLIEAKLSNASVNRHLATLRSMFNLAIRWGLHDGKNPAASPGMRPESGRDRYLSPVETRALVSALDLEKNRASAAALALLILTGARKNEVLKARWEHLDLDRGLLTVPRSKNGRPRHIPLSPTAARVLEMRVLARREGQAYIFPGNVPGRPLENVRRTWERAKKRAGLPADLRIHDLRHSFASALANSGTPLFEIAVILGHRELSTTARYSHHAAQRLVETASVAARSWELALPAPVTREVAETVGK